MADLKISQLPSATTPLVGTEVLPIVQSSATKRVSIANLTAGRSISVADATLTTGNLVIGTSGKGIDFSATGQAGGMTSELLNDYEEGTWTPAITGDSGGSGTTYTTQIGTYTKIGSIVVMSFNIKLSAKGTLVGGSTGIVGWPFTQGSIRTSNVRFGGLAANWINLWLLFNAPGNFAYIYGQTAASTASTSAVLAPNNVTDTTGFFGTVVVDIQS